VDALSKALRRTAFFAETHSPKAVLSAARLADRLPNLPESFFLDVLKWNHVFVAPEVRNLLSNEVIHDPKGLSDERMRQSVTGAVFPLAYLCAVEWVRRHGIRNLIDHYRQTALSRVSYLGHSWTIWCSFLETCEWISDEEDMFFCAERFAELVASELALPDGLAGFTLVPTLPVAVTFDADAVFLDICRRPGFFGHSLITLSYLYQYRNLVADANWQEALLRLQAESNDVTRRHDVIVDVSSDVHPLEEDTSLLSDRLTDYLLTGPQEAHTLTLSDAILRLSAFCSTHQRAVLVKVVEAFHAWRVERTATGERKKA